MFERFTRDARAVVHAAVAEAQERGDRHVGTEHLLLGVLASPSAVVRQVTQASGVDLPRARRTLHDADADALAAVGMDADALRPPPSAPARTPEARWRRPRRRPSHRPFTGGAKQTLEASLREAVALRHPWIGTEHLLLALTARTQPDPAAQLLAALDVDAPALHAALERRLATAA
jgi:ATP-dependent Clp protease ATP-binding subunit ClpA